MKIAGIILSLGPLFIVLAGVVLMWSMDVPTPSLESSFNQGMAGYPTDQSQVRLRAFPTIVSELAEERRWGDYRWGTLESSLINDLSPEDYPLGEMVDLKRSIKNRSFHWFQIYRSLESDCATGRSFMLSPSRTPLDDLIELLQSSGENSAVIYTSIPSGLRDDRSGALISIIRSSGDTAATLFDELPQEFLVAHLVELTLLVRYAGRGSIQAIQAMPISVLERHFAGLIEIARASGETTDQAFEALPLDLLESYEREMIDIALFARENTAQTYRVLPNGSMARFSRELIEICRAAGRNSPQALQNLPWLLMDNHAESLVEIARAAGINTHLAFESLPPGLMETNALDLVEIARAAGPRAYLALRALPIPLMVNYASALVEIARAAGINTYLAFESLPEQLMPTYSRELVEIARHSGQDTFLSFREIPGDLMQENPSMMVSLSRVSQSETSKAFQWLPRDLVRQNPLLIAALIEKYQNAFPSLCKVFGDRLFDLEKQFSDQLIQIAKIGGSRAIEALPIDLLTSHSQELVSIAESADGFTDKAFEQLPVQLMADHADFLVRLARRSRIQTFLEYDFLKSQLKSGGLGRSTPEKLIEQVELNANLFGIRYFHRYTNSPILNANIIRLKSGFTSRPKALVFSNKNDFNLLYLLFDIKSTFAEDAYLRNLEKLLQAYDVMAYEVESEDEVYAIIGFIGEQYGRISLLVFGGHGNQVGCNLGPIEDLVATQISSNSRINTRESIAPYEKKFIDVNDEDELSALSIYLEPEATIALVSCATGMGKEQADNLANTMSRAFPRRTILAPTKSFLIDQLKFELDSTGRLNNIRFGCETYRIQ